LKRTVHPRFASPPSVTFTCRLGSRHRSDRLVLNSPVSGESLAS
jgi:hypothetical protein